MRMGRDPTNPKERNYLYPEAKACLKTKDSVVLGQV